MKLQPVYKGQLLIKTTFADSLQWPIYTDITVLTNHVI